ncbi:hypothetical protein IKS57_01165 [bacterium]|nr:hypothetical protein [bacterium]
MYSINYQTKGVLVINGLQYQISNIVNNYLSLQNGQINSLKSVELTTAEPI